MKACEILNEGKFVGGHSPIDAGTPKQAGEIVRRLAMKEISFTVICHGDNPSHSSLKNKIYITVDDVTSNYEYAKEVADLITSGN